MCDAAVQVKIETKRLSMKGNMFKVITRIVHPNTKVVSLFIQPHVIPPSDEVCSASDGVEYIEEVG